MKRPGLLHHLFGGFLLVAMTGVLVTGVLVDRNVARNSYVQAEERLGDEATMLAQITAAALFGELDPSDTTLNDGVHALGSAVHTHLSLIAKDGTVVADSDSDAPLSLPKQRYTKEIAAACVNGLASSVRSEGGLESLHVARAIERDGKTLGFARSSVAMSTVHAHAAAVRARMAWGALVAALVALALGLAISMGIVRPVRALAAAAARIGDGDFSQSIEVTSSDEIGRLAQTFNGMSGALRVAMAGLDARNKDMRVVLDNVPEGLITIDRSGVMAMERSAVVDAWFGPSHEGDTFWCYIGRVSEAAGLNFHLGWEEVIADVLPLAVTLYQLPKRLVVKQRVYELAYTPILEIEGRLSKLLIVVSDATARIAAERAEEAQRELAQIFERAMHDRVGFLEFVRESNAQVNDVVVDPQASDVDLRRALHTLKGNFGVFGLARLASICHSLETQLGEGALLAGNRAAFLEAWGSFAKQVHSLLGEQEHALLVGDTEYSAAMLALRNGTPRRDVLQMLQEWRMDLASERLLRFGEQAKRLAERLGKCEVDIVVSQETIRLPRERWCAFWSSFGHIVRNAVDHGLETADERRDLGKTPRGSIRFSAARLGNETVIEVADDGRGIDWLAVGNRARARGLPFATDDQRVAALFHDGISTASALSEVSGRGVGLGAVLAQCTLLGGRVGVTSVAGCGSTFRFWLPSQVVDATVETLSPPARPDRRSAGERQTVVRGDQNSSGVPPRSIVVGLPLGTKTT